MGVAGLYAALGQGERVALTKYALEHHKKTGRRPRIAVDASIWSFQVERGKGGSNPALRTLYFRLLRLLEANVTLLFVFDGPKRPSFKRNKKINTTVTSSVIQLCKKLLKLLGLPFHTAPGEAEAECAALQQAGVVDAVMSEDVDTLMFGATVVLRSWGPANRKSSSTENTHISIYTADSIKKQCELDRAGMVLVALMKGGDYLPEGLPGCGLKTAMDAARAGFGAELSEVYDDPEKLQSWRQRLQYELKFNESAYFSRRNGNIQVDSSFPLPEALRNYSRPLVSDPEKVERIRAAIDWSASWNVPALREYTRETFEWRGTGGAAKFVRTLAPVLLSRWAYDCRPGLEELVDGISMRRTHPSTDGCAELRVAFMPINVIPIDKTKEEEDDALEAAEQAGVLEDDNVGSDEEEGQVTRAWSPYTAERIWLLERHVRSGLEGTVVEWEASKQKVGKRTKAPARQKKPTAASTTHQASLDKYLAVTTGNISPRRTPEPEKSQPLAKITRSRPSNKAPSAPEPSVETRTTRKGRPQTPPPRAMSLSPQTPTSELRRGLTSISLNDASPTRHVPIVPDPVPQHRPQVIDLSSSSESEEEDIPAATVARASAISARSHTQPSRQDAWTEVITVPSNASDTTGNKNTGRREEGPRKKTGTRCRVALRQSLAGVWTEAGEDRPLQSGQQVWEDVEIVDLTED